MRGGGGGGRASRLGRGEVMKEQDAVVALGSI